MHENSPRTTQHESSIGSQLLVGASVDTAKIGLALYLLGVFVSVVYYSRFSILTLDFLKAQAILLGCYVIAAYPIVPVLSILFLRNVAGRNLVAIAFCATVAAFDLAIQWASGHRGLELAGSVLAMFTLQMFCFVEFGSLLRSFRSMQLAVVITFPRSFKASVFGLLFCIHFALTILPGIPMYLGGAEPMPVQVFTKIEDLLANRFVPGQKDAPKVNKAIDSYSVQLLFETDKDIYFFSDLKTNENVFGHYVMRIPRDQITRIDYYTPEWVVWRH